MPSPQESPLWDEFQKFREVFEEDGPNWGILWAAFEAGAKAAYERTVSAMIEAAKNSLAYPKEEIQYAAFYEDDEGNFGAFAGPDPDVNVILNSEPDPLRANRAVILKILPNGETKFYYRWRDGRWRKAAK